MIEQPKRFLYVPSLSSGNSRVWLLKDEYISPNVPSRFYDDKYPEKFRYPYFLLSAGHVPLNPNFRARMGLEKSLVIGDSGGHQICTGAVKWDNFKKRRDAVFEFLESCSDIAMNLDIPPRVVYENRFQEALDISLDNFKYFEKKQTGKTDFLNILQVRSDQETEYWYNTVKGLNFKGWSVGSAGSIRKIMYTMALLAKNKELEKSDCKWLHYLGLTSVTYLFLFAMMQKHFNARYGNRLTLMTDSSSPNRATVFGQYYFNIEWKRMSYMSLTFSHKQTEYNPEMPLPCVLGCPACKDKTMKDLMEFDNYGSMLCTNHNLHLLNWIIDSVNCLVDMPYHAIDSILPKEFNLVNQSIGEILDSRDPIATYQKYVLLYERLSANYELKPDGGIADNFFSFE